MNTGQFVSPGFSMARMTRFDVIPLGALICVVVHACKGKNFELDASGNVPVANQVSLADFTGVPVYAVKTIYGWLNQDNSFVGSMNGYYGALTNLANGVVAIAGILPMTTCNTGDYVAQIRLIDGTGNQLTCPAKPLPIDLLSPVTTGGESGAPPTPTTYSGTVTIPSIGYLDIPITGLTVATGAVAALTQADNGFGVTSFLPTITNGNLRITAGSSGNPWVVYYALGSL